MKKGKGLVVWARYFTAHANAPPPLPPEDTNHGTTQDQSNGTSASLSRRRFSDWGPLPHGEALSWTVATPFASRGSRRERTPTPNILHTHPQRPCAHAATRAVRDDVRVPHAVRSSEAQQVGEERPDALALVRGLLLLRFARLARVLYLVELP